MRIIVVSLFFFASCTAKVNSKYTIDHFDEQDYNPEMIKKNKVISRSLFEIIYLNDSYTTKKLKSISYFNDEGFCSLKVIPQYYKVKVDTSEFDKLSALEKLFRAREVEGNIPNGLFDSTFYLFNEKGQLIKIDENKTNSLINSYTYSSIELKYDKSNKLISLCTGSGNSEILCTYTRYNYDKNGKVESLIDSFAEVSFLRNNPGARLRKFLYDVNGNVEFDGFNHYLYDDHNRISKKYIISDSVNIENMVENLYDSKGNCVKRNYIDAGNIDYDDLNKKRIFHYDTISVYKIYNEENLLIEKKEISKTQLQNLYKFDYTYKK